MNKNLINSSLEYCRYHTIAAKFEINTGALNLEIKVTNFVSEIKNEIYSSLPLKDVILLSPTLHTCTCTCMCCFFCSSWVIKGATIFELSLQCLPDVQKSCYNAEAKLHKHIHLLPMQT